VVELSILWAKSMGTGVKNYASGAAVQAFQGKMNHARTNSSLSPHVSPARLDTLRLRSVDFYGMIVAESP